LGFEIEIQDSPAQSAENIANNVALIRNCVFGRMFEPAQFRCPAPPIWKGC
jgi:hypothetical protein